MQHTKEGTKGRGTGGHAQCLLWPDHGALTSDQPSIRAREWTLAAPLVQPAQRSEG